MEGGGVKALVVMFMFVIGGTIAGQTYAASTDIIVKFSACFAKCFYRCNKPVVHLQGCAIQCLGKCMSSSASDMNNYCNLGCASSRCTTISTLQNHGEEAVGNCVGSCHDICNKHGY
ncbi:hypothetical protein IFM89_003243 [Coptis chinensis]|uniref:Thionin-like protein n=1 Tax=Coptis chinensis TaxID=261450 RepID=A0A835M6P4_9MAGN|nr:hypothetical protein IFM89_003243 [Coptis chinensis]